MTNFKHDKFRTADDTSYIIRNATLVSGVPVLFRVSGYNLSILKSENKFPDFDAESDMILENLKVTPDTDQIYFEWVGGEFHRM